jgi:GNAT superfamily N-acetyltransferase
VRFEIEPVAYDAAEVAVLIDELQGGYVTLYGSHDVDPTSPAAFRPPDGLFLLGRLDGTPVAMGGFRRRGADAAELKRMYVAASARGLGLGRRVLAELERAARAAGFARIVLNTGYRQLAAIALYESSGYLPIAPFGHYAEMPGARFYGKALSDDGPSEADGPYVVGRISG